MAQVTFGSFSPNSPDLIAAPRSSQPFAMAGLRRQSSEPSMHSMHSVHRLHPGSMQNGSPAYHKPLLQSTSPSAMYLGPEYHHWSPFVGHMPMTPGTFDAIQRGEFCAPGWSQNCSPSGSGVHIPATTPTTPSTPPSGRGWKALRPGLNVQVPPAGAWQDKSSQVHDPHLLRAHIWAVVWPEHLGHLDPVIVLVNWHHLDTPLTQMSHSLWEIHVLSLSGTVSYEPHER